MQVKGNMQEGFALNGVNRCIISLPEDLTDYRGAACHDKQDSMPPETSPGDPAGNKKIDIQKRSNSHVYLHLIGMLSICLRYIPGIEMLNR
jgi:hypothetical protein